MIGVVLRGSADRAGLSGGQLLAQRVDLLLQLLDALGGPQGVQGKLGFTAFLLGLFESVFQRIEGQSDLIDFLPNGG